MANDNENCCGGSEEAAHEALTSGLAARPGRLLLDYLRVRFTDSPEIRAELRRWLGPWTPRGRGWRGWYDESWAVLDRGIVAACGDPERAKTEGMLVDLSGRGCAALGDRLVPFFEWCTQHGVCTRVDYALDDRSGRLLVPERLAAAVRSGGLVKRWRAPAKEFHDLEGERPGWTLYVGRRASEAYVRIYDKAAEQGVPGPWMRFELETKGDLARELAREYFRVGSQAVIGQVNRRMRFVDPEASGGDTNRWRWPVASWWAEFLGSVEAGPSLVAGEKPVYTIEGMWVNVERQMAPSIAAVFRADGDWLRLPALVRVGEARLQARHLAAIAAVRGGACVEASG